MMSVDLSILSIIITLALGGFMAYNAAKKTSGSTLREQVATLTERVEDSDRKNAALQNSLALVHSELTAARDELAATRKRAAELQVLVDRLQSELDHYSLLVSTLVPRVEMRKDSNLFQALAVSFSDAEMKELAFGLGLDIELLGGTTKNEKALEMIGYFERREQLGELIAAIRKARPNAKIG